MGTLDVIIQHIEDFRRVKSRLGELQEFDAQWKDIFVKAEKLAGFKVRIKIRDLPTYYSYVIDKPHLLVSDFYSLLHGQVGPDSLRPILKGLADKFVLIPLDQCYPQDPAQAREIHKEHKKALYRLFPQIQPDMTVRDTDLECLGRRIFQLKERLRPLRHMLNHRYEYKTVAKYKAWGPQPEFHEIERLIGEYEVIIEDMALILTQISYDMDVRMKFDSSVKSSIDAIVFNGTYGFFHWNDISDLDLKNNNGQNPNNPKYYWQFREKFFTSPRFLEMLEKDEED